MLSLIEKIYRVIVAVVVVVSVVVAVVIIVVVVVPSVNELLKRAPAVTEN